MDFKFTRKSNKYNAKKHEYDGMTFASGVEMKRYIFLKEQESKGLISDLQCQVEYELLPNIYEEKVIRLKTKDKVVTKVAQRKVVYTPDFVYTKNGETIVEEVKGSLMLVSRDFPLRKKMMKYFHGIDVKVVTKATAEI